MNVKHLIAPGLALVLSAGPLAAQENPAPKTLQTRWAKEVTADNAWRQYPRPKLVRETWQNLNGLWDYAITAKDAPTPTQFDGQILVPFCVESSLSGVHKDLRPNQELWYQTTFSLPAAWKGQHIVLHFGAVDYLCKVWVNNKLVGTHEGGNVAFSFNIDKYLSAKGPQTLRLQVWDPTCEGPQARGKQKLDQNGIWYTPVSGIWQTVWVEALPQAAITSVLPLTTIANKGVDLQATFAGVKGKEKVVLQVFDRGKVIFEQTYGVHEPLRFTLPQAQLWSPDCPQLYHFNLSLLSAAGKTLDSVRSYFALREVSQQKDALGRNRIALNGKTLFQYGTLDQGWWPDGLLTPPTAEAMRYDMEVLKAMGFNSLRKHIKVEPELYYYYADSLGLMVWQDMVSGFPVAERDKAHVKANAPTDWNRPEASVKQWEEELFAMIDHLRFYPCITTWVVFNEGWGQYNTAEVVNRVMDYDKSRLINGVSGWTDRGVGHMYDVHNYPVTAMQPVENIQGRISVLGEFGGLGLPVPGHLWNPDMRNWGYANYAGTTLLQDSYFKLMYDMENLIAMGLAAAIYTQTTDVEGEVNGLMTYDREINKFPVALSHALHHRLYTVAPAAAKDVVTDTRVKANRKAVAFGEGAYQERDMPLAKVNSPVVRSRATFRLTELPKGLSLFLNMNDKGRVYLNGKLVLSADNLRLTRSYNHYSLNDYVHCLQVGENVIEVVSESPKKDRAFDYCLYTL